MASEEPGAAVEVDPHQLQSTQELTTFVQTLLTQMQGRFATMSDQIIGRIDEMGTRIDELESSIGELMTQVCWALARWWRGQPVLSFALTCGSVPAPLRAGGCGGRRRG
ncbi:heat shock factor binding protein 1-domain-containing protein [Pavlovales sp. CCMP2436]|nr:heat shock factor binding protein 1-domain-containing protein [Pavlovales sp. CCMP2436]